MVAYTFLLLATLSTAQKTYQPYCGCDSIIDGKCVYTLHLPIYGAGNTADTMQSQCSVQEQTITDINSNLGQLNEQLAEAKNHISQLQSGLIDIQSRALNQTALLLQLASQREKLEVVGNSLDMIFRGVEELSVKVDDDDDKIQSQEQLILALSIANNKTLTRIKHVEDELKAVMGNTGLVCAQQALLVTGLEEQISLDQIKVSSMYDNTHGADKLRINTEIKPAAWCACEYKS